MYPRLYMQSFQFATYDRKREKVTFESRLSCGKRRVFPLTKNQFFGLNDAILLMETKDNDCGYYPLGDNVWMHYHYSDVCLYKNMKDTGGRIYFNFASFWEYKMHTHRRLLSLVRLEGSDAAAETSSWRRKRYIKRGGRGGRCERQANIASYKRPLSIVVQSSNQSPSLKRHRGEMRTTLSRATDNAVMSHPNKESAILPERYSANTRRWGDSFSSVSSTSKSLSTPETVQLFSPSDTIDAMESE